MLAQRASEAPLARRAPCETRATKPDGKVRPLRRFFAAILSSANFLCGDRFMTCRAALLIAIGLTMPLAAPAQAQPKGGRGMDGSKYGWLSSLEEGKAQARKSGKPL